MEMQGNDALIEIFAYEVRRTEKAILVNDGNNDIWLPFSQIEIREYNDQEGKPKLMIGVREWLAIQKGLV